MTFRFFSLPRAAALSIALTVLAPSIALAQTPGTASPAGATTQAGLVWNLPFARLIQGKNLVVTTSDGTEYQGVFTLSPTTMIAAGRNAGEEVPFDQIVRVEKVSYRVRTLALIGLASGAGIGIWAACHDNSYCLEEPYWFLSGGLGAGIGAGAGAAIGAVLNAVHRNDDVIFDAARRTTTMALAPILSPTRKGLAFSLTWR